MGGGVVNSLLRIDRSEVGNGSPRRNKDTVSAFSASELGISTSFVVPLSNDSLATTVGSSPPPYSSESRRIRNAIRRKWWRDGGGVMARPTIENCRMAKNGNVTRGLFIYFFQLNTGMEYCM